MAEELLDFAQILSYMVEEDRRCGIAQSVRGDLPHPKRSASGARPQIERAVEKWLARISRKYKLRSRKVYPTWSQ